MTESIKQWIADQAIEIAKVPAFSGGERVSYERQLAAISGLTKGIEIAEGFAEWVEDLYIQDFKGKWYLYEDFPGRDYNKVEFLTTSQLLEKYLNQLQK